MNVGESYSRALEQGTLPDLGLCGDEGVDGGRVHLEEPEEGPVSPVRDDWVGVGQPEGGIFIEPFLLRKVEELVRSGHGVQRGVAPRVRRVGIQSNHTPAREIENTQQCKFFSVRLREFRLLAAASELRREFHATY